ncbi:MAG: D-alanyl-D-alanine carboxypeptidase [Roseburia sp.]|nr:D-alanyl-D-alanine carboxypeptidase [Ruminococcus sp.]MCM1154564.1 D-alanyl-D-alanine carboxypeptidase [Roseburia sp.]MCM1243045.1 D-alanyl-D-alanine carboxypeptidase [Roseburia sp.]
MKCTNKGKTGCALLLAFSMMLTGCGAAGYDMPYDSNSPVSSFKLMQVDDNRTAEPFAADLCVVAGDVSNADVTLTDIGAAALFDVNGLDTLYAKNANTQVNPASLTKIMTALVALKYGSADQMLTASDNVIITESGAQLCGIKPGDSMTLGQALHILLLYSANDVAIMIAEGVGGSVSAFVDLMNEEALELGATNCHFMNPNGLTEEGHYVTAYDLYLIFQEALKYDLFNEIIQMSSFSTTYTGSNGNEYALDVNTTNQYISGNYSMPEGITVIGGKTGTTRAAGHCLILLARNTSGSPYIAVIMNSSSTEELYQKMNDLLKAAH